MKTLRENITSKYLEAANRLRSKSARRRIVAYVESYDDVFFWRTVLSPLEDDTRYFEVMLPSHQRLERGKKSVLMNLLSQQVGEDMIACVDADYDWLIQGATHTSRQMIGNPYVFHTYAYAIENLQCYAPSLHDVCVMATLNDHQVFDLEEFIRQYSVAIFPLFVWSVWYYRRADYHEFTITQFSNVIELGGFSLQEPEACIARLRRKVSHKISQLQQKNPDAKESYLALKRELTGEMGITPDTTYLYIQGHHFFNKVVLPVMNKVCSRLVREREQEIRQQAIHDTQRRNELSCYSHSTQDVEQMLKKNVAFLQSEPYRRLRSDLERFVAGRKTAAATNDLSRTQA
ncbi:MAG: DUF4435 domain-containing protein [Prevotella sp.]|nr:DUF4435 domain-containing protein [Prevotella sp.]MBQ9651330.1 DUF4435 domain-containing protein [Prevotella sp.]